MRKASVSDLRIHISQLLRDAENGEVIVIERRGQPIAELRPLSKDRPQPPLPDMTEFWARYPQIAGDSTETISEDRDR